jgi:hypothetical protein
MKVSMIRNLHINLQKMFIATKNLRSMQRVSPPKRGAAEPVNLKTHRNPAKTAQRPFGLVRSRAHLFARISSVFKERASHRLGRWFSCRKLSALPKQKDNKQTEPVPDKNIHNSF